MMDALISDIRARSAQGPHASLLKTWDRLHRRWFGDDPPVIPLSPASILAVAAQMKDAGYRSFPNYGWAAKDLHITSGFPWTDILHAAITQASASTQRGIGPPHQCGEIELAPAVTAIGDDPAPLVVGGPACCDRMFILSYFHVARGMEVICANAIDLSTSVRAVDVTESWRLSVSKTDPQAIGCTRTWGCICPASPCPAHTAIAHLQWLSSTFGDATGVLPPGLPLFPCPDGSRPSAERLSATVEEVARRLGLPLVDTMGRSAFTEHVFRVSGARMLARASIPVDVIMLLARWSSDVVRRYIGEAPLATLTTRFANRATGCASPPPPAAAPVAVASPPAGATPPPQPSPLPASDATVHVTSSSSSSDDLRIRELETQVDLLASELHPQYVRNLRSGAVHNSGPAGPLQPRCLWRAPCGWQFGTDPAMPQWITTLHGIDADLICGTCLPDERTERMLLTLFPVHAH